MKSRFVTGVVLGAAVLALALATTGCGDDSMADPGPASAPAVLALDLEDGARGPGGFAARLECRLGLTDAQTEEIRAIMKDEFGDVRAERRARMEARRAGRDAAPTSQEWKAKAAERAVARVERIEKVAGRIRATLTAEQAGEFDLLLQEMRAVAADGGGPVAHLGRKLDLTAGQKAQIEALFESRRVEHQARRAERRALRDDNRPLGREARALRREFREGRGEFHNQLRSILTPEQQAKLDAERQKWQDCRGD